MKWVFRLFTLALLGVALGLPFFMNNKQGQPMLSLPSLSDMVPERATIRTVYKWQDAEGVWHYGDSAPADGTYSSLEVSDQTNVIQLLTDEERASLKPAPAEPANNLVANTAAPTPPPADGGLTLERALNLVNEAKAVRDQMNARTENLQRTLGGQ